MKQPQPKTVTRVDILVQKGQEELFTDRIYQLSGYGFWLEDQGNFILLKCYPGDPDALLKTLSIHGSSVVQIHVEEEELKDYEELTRRYFRPIRVDNLQIRAPWNKESNRAQEIVIEPGMAFGTGRHESTRIMIKLMGTLDFNGKKVLDVGCGSGILALYAHLLGARAIKAVDNDPDAIANASKNIKLNSAASIELTVADIQCLTDSADIILANLDIATFTKHGARIASLLGDRGYLIASGILGRDRARFLNLFPGHHLYREERKNGWRGFVFEIDKHSPIR